MRLTPQQNCRMVKLKKIIFNLILIVGLTSCVNFEEVEITDIKQIKVEEFGNKSLTLAAEIKIKNPNSFSIKLVDSKFDLFIKNEKIGIGEIVSDLKLPSQSNDYYDVRIKSEFSDLKTNTLMSLMQSSIFMKKKVPFKVKGFVKGRALMITKKIDLEHSGDVPLKF